MNNINRKGILKDHTLYVVKTTVNRTTGLFQILITSTMYICKRRECLIKKL